jgi:hypothetical protein
MILNLIAIWLLFNALVVVWMTPASFQAGARDGASRSHDLRGEG